MEYSVYIVDDEVSVRKGLHYGFQSDYLLKSFASAESAIETIRQSPPDLVLLDIGLPGMSGIEALKEIKKISRQTLVIMITAYEDIDNVIEAMKAGAHDYVVKPINLNTIRVNIKNALETIRLQKEVKLLQEKYLQENMPLFISESNAISDIMGFVEKAAKSPDTPILITGSSGTGKEIIASAIHHKSPNFKGPFISINCAAIPDELIESELFGYEKGAFSGANPAGKKGMIDQAQEGTLFLDEIGDLSQDAQAKLLRFLEDGEYYRVGGIKKMKARTRVVSATNKDLEKMIEEGLYRLDLYYRIGVIKIHIPSLNNRVKDIIPIARHFLVEFAEKMGKQFTGISKEAEAYLKNHQWKGNVRELKNLIERGVLIEEGTEITLKSLGVAPGHCACEKNHAKTCADAAFENQSHYNFCTLDQAISNHIKKVLEKTDGRVEGKGGASEILDMNPSTLRSRMRKLNIRYGRKTEF